jgi:hypothetical protein
MFVIGGAAFDEVISWRKRRKVIIRDIIIDMLEGIVFMDTILLLLAVVMVMVMMGGN